MTDFELLLNILDQLLLLQREGHVELRDPQLTDGLVLLVLRVGGFYVDFVEFIESSVSLLVGEYPGWLHPSLKAFLEPVEIQMVTPETEPEEVSPAELTRLSCLRCYFTAFVELALKYFVVF